MASTSNEKPPPRKRFVVSSFICKRTDTHGELLVSIFKRSDQVRSYKFVPNPGLTPARSEPRSGATDTSLPPCREKWAACSGSIDATDTNPLAAAWRELEEETTLTSTDLTLLRPGKSYSIVDEELNTEWTIYPFAFLLRPGPKTKTITIDWEHTEHRFIRPEELQSYDTVPHLSASLCRVVVTADLAAGLKALQTDHQNGARVLATRALETLRDAGVNERARAVSSTQEYWREMRMVGWHIAKNGRPSMGAAISYVVLDALDKIRAETMEESDVTTFKQKASGVIQRIAQDRTLTPDRMASQFQQYIETSADPSTCKILTLSSSSTVRHCLIELLTRSPDRRLELFVLESRPLFEGVTMAESILNTLNSRSSGAASRIKVTVAPDSAAALLAKEASIILLGADRISSEGDVSNKMGSLPTVVVAKMVSPQVKVAILSEAEKIAPPQDRGSVEREEEDNDVEEVTRGWPFSQDRKQALLENDVKVRNVYFEKIPAKLIDAYICEDGVLSVGEIERRSQQIADLEGKIWGDM
ncbi:MAG: hypothetical protein M4579_001631 [Chaenotheca gracillima]|nr:MAG: hypothetical protein M4579_001631 [Chaenotheca gracillima]